MIFLRSEFGHQLIQKTSLPGKQLGFGNLNWDQPPRSISGNSCITPDFLGHSIVNLLLRSFDGS